MGKRKNNNITKKCMVCHEPYKVKPSRKDISITCSKKCAIEHDRARQLAIHVETVLTKTCPQCNKIFTTIQSENKTYCCKKCKDIGIVGKYTLKNNLNFKRQIIVCAWCGKEKYKKINLIEKDKTHTCSNECKKKYHKYITSQTDEYRQRSRENVLKMLENGSFNTTNTKPQLTVNELLLKNNIEFINEKVFGNYSFDIYLPKFNKCIEIMGTYWHCDIRKYKEINYNMQFERIIRDKSKYSYIKNNTDVSILYLWEHDIETKEDLYENIIKNFIYNDYPYIDSMTFYDNIIPYYKLDTDIIKNITDTTVIKERSRKDESKWIKYKCEFCGEDCEELISQYDKKKTHCCSRKCSGSLKMKNFTRDKKGRIQKERVI